MQALTLARDPRVRSGVAAVIALAAAAASWRFAWVPSVAARARAQQEATALRDELAQVDALLAVDGGPEVWLSRQRARLGALAARLAPSRELPGLLDAVLEQVTRSELRVANVGRGNLGPAVGSDGAALSMNGAPVLTLPVVVAVEGRFAGVVDCLQRWSDPGFPGLLGIERVEMTLLDPLTGRLGATIQVKVHVVDAS